MDNKTSGKEANAWQKLPPAEKKALRELFEEIDIHKKNNINFSQLARYMTKKGFEVNTNDIRLMMQEADENRDGSISFEEFIKVAFAARQYKTSKGWRDAVAKITTEVTSARDEAEPVNPKRQRVAANEPSGSNEFQDPQRIVYFLSGAGTAISVPPDAKDGSQLIGHGSAGESFRMLEEKGGCTFESMKHPGNFIGLELRPSGGHAVTLFKKSSGSPLHPESWKMVSAFSPTRKSGEWFSFESVLKPGYFVYQDEGKVWCLSKAELENRAGKWWEDASWKLVDC